MLRNKFLGRNLLMELLIEVKIWKNIVYTIDHQGKYKKEKVKRKSGKGKWIFIPFHFSHVLKFAMQITQSTQKDHSDTTIIRQVSSFYRYRTAFSQYARLYNIKEEHLHVIQVISRKTSHNTGSNCKSEWKIYVHPFVR